MKRISMIVLFFVLSINFLTAQDIKWSSIKAGFGKGALTSGFDVTFKWSYDQDEIELTGNNDRAYLGYYWNAKSDVVVGVTGGYFKNTPWLGAQLTVEWTDVISTLHWVGGRVNPLSKTTEWDPGLFFNFHGIYVTVINNFSVSYALMHFTNDKPLHLFGATYNVELNDNTKIGTSIDYSYTADELLYCLNMKYSF